MGLNRCAGSSSSAGGAATEPPPPQGAKEPPMHPRSPSQPTPRRLRRVVAGGLAVAVVGALSVLAPGAPASAAPQTDAIRLGEAGTAPTGGTLPNQVAWSVNVGDWHPEQGYAAFPGDSPQVWEFD